MLRTIIIRRSKRASRASSKERRRASPKGRKLCRARKSKLFFPLSCEREIERHNSTIVHDNTNSFYETEVVVESVEDRENERYKMHFPVERLGLTPSDPSGICCDLG